MNSAIFDWNQTKRKENEYNTTEAINMCQRPFLPTGIPSGLGCRQWRIDNFTSTMWTMSTIWLQILIIHHLLWRKRDIFSCHSIYLYVIQMKCQMKCRTVLFSFYTGVKWSNCSMFQYFNIDNNISIDLCLWVVYTIIEICN